MARTNQTARKSASGKAPRKQLATNVSAEERCAHQTVELPSSRHELEQAANIGLPESDPDEADASHEHPGSVGSDSNPSGAPQEHKAPQEHSPFTFQFAAPSPDTPYTTPKKVNKRAARRSATKPVLLKFDAAPAKISLSPAAEGSIEVHASVPSKAYSRDEAAAVIQAFLRGNEARQAQKPSSLIGSAVADYKHTWRHVMQSVSADDQVDLERGFHKILTEQHHADPNEFSAAICELLSSEVARSDLKPLITPDSCLLIQQWLKESLNQVVLSTRHLKVLDVSSLLTNLPQWLRQAKPSVQHVQPEPTTCIATSGSSDASHNGLRFDLQNSSQTKIRLTKVRFASGLSGASVSVHVCEGKAADQPASAWMKQGTVEIKTAKQEVSICLAEPVNIEPGQYVGVYLHGGSNGSAVLFENAKSAPLECPEGSALTIHTGSAMSGSLHSHAANGYKFVGGIDYQVDLFCASDAVAAGAAEVEISGAVTASMKHQVNGRYVATAEHILGCPVYRNVTDQQYILCRCRGKKGAQWLVQLEKDKGQSRGVAWSAVTECLVPWGAGTWSVVEGPEPAKVQPSVVCSRVTRARQPVNTDQQCGSNCESCNEFETLAGIRCFCTECHDKWDKEEKPSFETLMTVVSPEFRLVSCHQCI